MNPARIVQPNSWSCAACVAAMATGTTLEDVLKFIGHDGSAIVPESIHPEKRRGFSMQEILRYMLSLDFYMGAFCSCGHGFSANDPKEGFVMALDLKNPAMAVVKSSRLSACSHTLYWDGEKLLDPHSFNENPPQFKDLKFTEWWPIIKFV